MAKNVKWKSQISLPVPATDDTEAVRLKEFITTGKGFEQNSDSGFSIKVDSTTIGFNDDGELQTIATESSWQHGVTIGKTNTYTAQVSILSNVVSDEFTYSSLAAWLKQYGFISATTMYQASGGINNETIDGIWSTDGVDLTVQTTNAGREYPLSDHDSFTDLVNAFYSGGVSSVTTFEATETLVDVDNTDTHNPKVKSTPKLNNTVDTVNDLLKYNADKSTAEIGKEEVDSLLNSTIDDNGNANIFIGPDDGHKTDNFRVLYKSQIQNLIASAITSQSQYQGTFKFFGVQSDLNTIASQVGQPFTSGDVALAVDSITTPTTLKKGTYADTANHWEASSIAIADGGKNYVVGDALSISGATSVKMKVTSTHNGHLEEFDTTNYTNITGNFNDGDILTITATGGSGTGGEWLVLSTRTDTASTYTVPDTLDHIGHDCVGYEIGDSITLSNGTNTLDTKVTEVIDGIITGINITNHGDESSDFTPAGVPFSNNAAISGTSISDPSVTYDKFMIEALTNYNDVQVPSMIYYGQISNPPIFNSGDKYRFSNGSVSVEATIVFIYSNSKELSLYSFSNYQTPPVTITGGTGSGATASVVTQNNKTGIWTWVDAQPTPANGMWASINNYVDSTTNYQWSPATILYLSDGSNPAQWVIDQSSILIFIKNDSISPSYYHGSKGNAYYDLTNSQYVGADEIFINHFGAIVSFNKTALDDEDEYAIGSDNMVYKFSYDKANSRVNVTFEGTNNIENDGWYAKGTYQMPTNVTAASTVYGVLTLTEGNTEAAWYGATSKTYGVVIPEDGLYAITINDSIASAAFPTHKHSGYVRNSDGTNQRRAFFDSTSYTSASIPPVSGLGFLKKNDIFIINSYIGGAMPSGITIQPCGFSIARIRLDQPIQQEPDVFFKAHMVIGSTFNTPNSSTTIPLQGDINAGLMDSNSNIVLPKGKYLITIDAFGLTTGTPTIQESIFNGNNKTVLLYKSDSSRTVNNASTIVESDGVTAIRITIATSVAGTVIDPTVLNQTNSYIRAYRLPNNNSDLMNKPNLWPVGVELDFGDGVYGQRFTGTITSAENGRANTIIGTLGGPYNKIDSKGYWSDGTYKVAPDCAGMTSSLGVGYASVVLISEIDYRVRLLSYSVTVRSTPQPYDVAITYTKS